MHWAGIMVQSTIAVEIFEQSNLYTEILKCLATLSAEPTIIITYPPHFDLCTKKSRKHWQPEHFDLCWLSRLVVFFFCLHKGKRDKASVVIIHAISSLLRHSFFLCYFLSDDVNTSNEFLFRGYKHESNPKKFMPVNE